MVTRIIIAALGIIIAYFVYNTYNDPSNEGTFLRLFSTITCGLYIGLLGVFYVLPALSQKAAQSMFSDSNEKADQDMLHLARALIAQGEYQQAVIAYRKALIKDPSNRLAWNDMAKLYAEKLNQPQLAIASLREAYDDHEWEEDDAAFILFRISEWQIRECEDKKSSAETLKEIMETFPDTRHSANAMQQLHQQNHHVELKSV